jgi:hypothetical protein
LQNEVDNSGIKGLEEQDLGTVTVNPNEKETVSAFPQFTDQEKSKRGLEDFRTLKKNFKSALPHIPNLAQEFAPGADLLRYFGVLGDIGGEQTFQPSTKENVATGIKKIKEGQRVEGAVDVATGGLETLGAASDVMILGAGLTGPLAPVLLGAGVALKGITKTGLAILKSKKGKTFFAKLKGNNIQLTPRKNGTGYESTAEVESIVASKPEDVEELGNTDNLPISYSESSTEQILEKEGRRNRFQEKSRLNQAIDTLQNKASGEQFLRTLEKKGNYSPEELEQSGLKDFLLSEENKNKTISLDNIKNYMDKNTPYLSVERRVRYPSGEDDFITEMTFDNEEAVSFGDSGRYDLEMEMSQEYMFENRTGSPVNDLLVYKLKERDGVTTGPDEANFFQFADQAQVKKETIKEIEDNAKKLIEDIPSYAEVTSQTDLFDPDKTKRFLEMGEDEYYEQAIKDKRDKLDNQTEGYDALEERYFLDQDGFITEEYARTAYDDQPEMIYTDSGTGYQIIGDEQSGYYSIRREDGEFVNTDASSYDEARIQAQQDAQDRGILEYEYDDEEDYAERVGKTLYHNYKTNLGKDESYEELPYKIQSKKSLRNVFFDAEQNHFRQVNNVGHLRTTIVDETLPSAKGRKIFLVEEFQQDPVNVARKDGGFAPSKEDIDEIQKIVGDDKIGQNTSGVINITGSDGTLYSYSRDPFETGSVGGFVNSKMIEGQGTTLIKHPKNNEILAYLKKNKLNPAGSVDSGIPFKNDGYKFNFRLALSEAVDKNQSHMNYVAGETHALRYGEAIPLDSVDRVPDKLLKDEYKTFVREVNEGRYNDNTLRYNRQTGESRAEYVAGRDGTEIALPFNPDDMSPKYKGKLEGYAQDRTQEDFFDDIMMVDINFQDTNAIRDSTVKKTHLMVNKKTDEILGVFYSDQNPNMRRPSQESTGKMFHETQVSIDDGNVGRITNRTREMGDSFKLKESDFAFRGKANLPDKISELLTKDELEKLKKDSTEENYLDQFADISTEGRVIGGEGKKKLYNNMIKKYGEKYLKKIDPDVKIQYEILEDPNGNPVPTYGFKITDKIRKHILTEGIESFSKGGAVIILRNNKKKPQPKKYVPQIVRKNYGAFIDKQYNSYDIIDG